MTDLPRFGQYAEVPRKENCPRHPGTPAIDYCKRCNRPTCPQCTIPTEVGSVCVDCSRNRSGLAGAGPKALRLRAPGHQPVVTYGIIGSAVLVFLVSMVWQPIDGYLAFNPALAYSQPWRFLTVSLVHGGFFHLLFNMMLLYFIGVDGEQKIGHWRFLSLFLLSTLGGSVAVLAWTMVSPASAVTWTVGASGAVYGLLGAIFVESLHTKTNLTPIVVLLVINLGFSFMNWKTISWQGHVGGLLVGALVAWLYLRLSRPKPGVTERTQSAWEAAATAAVAASLVVAAWGIYQTFPPGLLA